MKNIYGTEISKTLDQKMDAMTEEQVEQIWEIADAYLGGMSEGAERKAEREKFYRVCKTLGCTKQELFAWFDWC